MRYPEFEAKRIGLDKLLDNAADPIAQAHARAVRAANVRLTKKAAA